MKTLAMLLAAGSLFLTCAINPRLQTEGTKPDKALQNAMIKVPVPQAHQHAAQTGYRLGYGDILEVKFFNNPEYNEVVAVRPDGKITLQRVGDVQVVGISVSRLDSLVTSVYAEILLHPDVTIFVREFGGQSVYVMGEVEKPGQYDYVKGMSLLRAIATAGGPLRGAKLNSIILVRGDEQQNLVVNRLDLTPTNVTSIIQNDGLIQPYDLIYVPKTFVADLEMFVTQLYKVVIPPLNMYNGVATYLF